MDSIRFSDHAMGDAGRRGAGQRAGNAISAAASGRWRLGQGITACWVSIFRNTPLLVQLLFWYFAAWNFLPQGLRDFVNDPHDWSILPGNVWWLTRSFCARRGGWGCLPQHSWSKRWPPGCRACQNGQREAALAQGFSTAGLLRHVLLPQGLANAWQPVVGQYLNLMKLSSLASGIGFAELTYQVRQIESYNAHALEAFAVGTVLYLFTGGGAGTAADSPGA
ncbi:Glutamine transport system permease protein glnP [Kluyvera cryocrescens]|uniref:Glutamine transport system permease protein glnP n=1 Tax=Kluyvera cryocrescens TaxID=580 RepID=A0A485CDR1_KLUCR|nr:Glutamine transport system permease protein glnP [Kluyvera cryocrescens]